MTELFERLFARSPEASAAAPGRLNLIGEHTDYNGGFVLPIALPHRTQAHLARRRDSVVVVRSVAIADGSTAETYELGKESAGRGWLDYVQGVTKTIALNGHRMSGFDLLIESNVPIGRGVSSSAALEVAVAKAVDAAFDLRMSPLEIAKVAHLAETRFVGAPVGIMDQMAASLADESAALLIDTLTLSFERIPLPSSAELAAIDSGISHHHASGEYRARRRECEEAATLLGVTHLRELGADDTFKLKNLPKPLDRRVRHVITENERVLNTVRAFRDNDLVTAGRLFVDSHVSMRDDFEVSIPEIDRLVSLATSEPGVYGARLTGGGFGGSIVVLCQRDRAAIVAADVTSAYRASTKRDGHVLLPPPLAM